MVVASLVLSLVPIITPIVTAAVSSCTAGDYYEIGEFRLLNNQWGTTNVNQCIFLNDDGTYGWNWERGQTGVGPVPNYPEVEFGVSPWGGTSTTTLLPLQIKDITSAEMTIDVDMNTWLRQT